MTEIEKRIHDLLVTRNERAAERMLMLEYRIAEMYVQLDTIDWPLSNDL